MPRLRHANCHIYRECPACNRNADAVGMFAGTFGCLVFLTVAPVTVLLVLIAHEVFGETGAWVTFAFLVTLPFTVAAGCWLYDDRRTRP